MVLALAFAILSSDPGDAPKRPDLGTDWRVVDLRGANELKIHPNFKWDQPSRWVRLYGIDVPNASQSGYSGARQDLELLLGRTANAYYEDENRDHPIMRNASYVAYVWAWGKLLEFELVKDGWARVNDEGRKGRYGKYLTDAEEQAKRWHVGVWASGKD